MVRALLSRPFPLLTLLFHSHLVNVRPLTFTLRLQRTGDFDDEAVEEMEEAVWKNPAVVAAVSPLPRLISSLPT